jgi:hypothetical protein
MPWKTFFAAHWDGLAAADFFTVEVLTVAGLVRYVVLFVMKRKTRTVEIAGISSQPDGSWMTQLARNLTDADDGFLRGMEYLILDRDPLYTAVFRSAAEQWCEAIASACSESQFERFRRAVCGVRQVRVRRPNRATRRETSPSRRPRVHGSLSRGTTAPGFGQRTHRAEDHVTRTGPNTLP